MANVWKNHQFAICLIVLGIISFPSTDGDLVAECNEKCSTSVATATTNTDSTCDYTCRSTSCNAGCSSWDNSTLAECYTVCNVTYSSEPDKVQYCQSGCLFAEDLYATEIIEQIGQPSAPIPSDKKATTLTLTWVAADNSAVLYLVEWRYAEGVGGAWNYYGSPEPISETSLDLTGLIPYALYQFRVLWVVTPRHILTSPPMDEIRMDPSGVPSTAPSITSAISSSPTSISVTWDPPPFANGPITGYTVVVQSFLNEPAVGWGSAGESTTQATISNDGFFQAETLYAVSVAASNTEGLGLSDTVNVTTAAAPNVTGVVPYMVIGVTSLSSTTLTEASTVSFVAYDDLGSSNEPSDIHTVDNENSTIKDVAVLYQKNMVFISDSDGTIHRRVINTTNLTEAPSEVLYNNTDPAPTKLDADWLNEKLYFVQGTEILRCDLNVSDCEVAVTNIASVPMEMKVDSYVGYLFWSVIDSGIYRVPISSSTVDAASATNIISLSGPSAFTVNSQSLQILYSNSTGNSLHSASLDGSDQSQVRTGDISSPDHQFDNTTSLVYFNSTFIWTQVGPESVATCFGLYPYTGGEALNFEMSKDVYSTVDAFFCVDGYHGLDVFYPTYQPVPVPIFAPSDLQVLFTDSSADISWTRPQSLPGLGEGAWEEWLYEVTITNEEARQTTTLIDISGVSVLEDNLAPGSEYSVQVRAYSDGGFGPSSEAFSGTTLMQVDVDPYLLLANETQLWSTALDGNAANLILDPEAAVEDIDWYGDYFIWSTGSGQLYRSLAGASASDQLTIDPSDISSSIEALAVEWLSESIYWADTNQNQILRGRLSNSTTTVTSSEVIIPFAGDVQDIAIDSGQAHLYWTTDSSVEGALLNGDNPLVYYEAGDFSLDIVAGLTLDLDGGYVYWFLVSRQNSVEELKLYRAELAGLSSDPTSTTEEISQVMSATTSLALHFYSSKLFWIDSEASVVVSDDQGQRQALLPVSGVQTLTIVQDTLKPLPAGFTEPPSVVPEAIGQDYLIAGTWDSFNITWNPSSVDYGTVFYTITVAVNSTPTYEATVTSPYYTIEGLAPFQPLDISIFPYTYWGSSPLATFSDISPMSVPSIPLDPRAFALEDTDIMSGNTTYSAEFRWSQPAELNGILGGYFVSWGVEGERQNIFMVEANEETYTVSDLQPNTTYTFQVEAYTEVGSGDPSQAVSITTGVSSPPPVLVVSTGGDITLTDVDTMEQTKLLEDQTVSVLAIVANEETVFYVKPSGDDIFKSNFAGDDSTDIADLASPPSTQASFVIDWVTQILYWSDAAAIFKFDTTVTMVTVETIYTPSAGSTIGGLGVNPHGSSLVWTESSVLMTSDLSGQNAAPLFGATNRRRRATENCTCSDTMATGSAVYLDSSDPNDVTIYFVDSATSDLWVSDIEGCQCQMLFDASSETNAGLPPDTLSVDTSRVYWSNAAQGIVASVDKETGSDFTAQTGQTDVDFVLTYGTSLQPYPDPDCLAPSEYDQPTELITDSSDSLSLTFDPVPQCPDVSTATPVYTTHYANVDSEMAIDNCTTIACTTKESTNTSVILGSLEPYSFYLTQVSVRNLYSTGSPALGPVAIHRTSPGVPSESENVSVSVLTPSEASVSWAVPAEVNGPLDELRFKVSYTSDTEIKTAFGDTIDEGEGQYSVMLEDLTADTDYTFIVESYQESMSASFSSSQALHEATFQVPDTVQAVDSTNTSLSVSWTAPDDDSATSHQIEYTETSQTNWRVASSGNTTSGTMYNVTIGSLTPYTEYQVRSVVTYTSGLEYTYTGDEDVLSTMTDASGPDPPGQPTWVETSNEVRWTAPTPNGPGTLNYILDYRATSSGKWTPSAYNGSNTYWVVSGLPTGDRYTFRVKAENDLYEGPYSPMSTEVFLPDPTSDNTIYIVIGCVVGVLVIVAFVIIYLVVRHRKTEKWVTGSGHGEDLELARLRNYPNMQIRQENSNYAITHEGQEVLLPIFSRECLKLITFLGSGAFGEVFEGNALDIMGSDTGETRVAVKTLRKGATDQEKNDFLKEATVMGKFKHPNIVALLGVCLDNDPQYIILELMEGGDLLSYVRAARIPPSKSSKISLMDQIEIILDVAKGCEYLEEIRFVHRDLAARNCLVSTKSYNYAKNRIVKIGDFGLARDIYKNDYYRKEGEGLLPVRWMAPEGLMDGYFSIQSDIWAYGVLVWEVVSGGQQPYPARSNVEVLRFVEAGGRLNQPEKCPDDIYQLMRRCWEKSPDDRPSFKMVKEMVQDFRRKSGGPRDNFGFEGDGNVNYSHVKDIPPEMEDYLLPFDSKSDIIKKKPDIELPPDIDYDQADQNIEEELKKGKRKGSKKGATRSPFNSFRSRLQGGAGEGGQPRLEAALQDIAQNRERRREVDDDRYLKHPVGSLSKATGAGAAPQPQSPTENSLTVPDLSNGAAACADVELEGAVGYTPEVTVNGDAHVRTEPPNYAQPKKRHPNPFRANSIEQLDGYDNLAFGATGDISATDYANV